MPARTATRPPIRRPYATTPSALAALAALLLSASLACGKEALYEDGGDEPRLSNVQLGANPGPNQSDRVIRYEYDGDGRLTKESNSATSYSGFNLRDNAPGNRSALQVTDYIYEGDLLVASETRQWRNLSATGCPATDESCYDLTAATTFSDFVGGLPARTVHTSGPERSLRDECTNSYDAAGHVTATRCAERPSGPGEDSVVVISRYFYDDDGNIRQSVLQNERAPYPQQSISFGYHPTLLNPLALRGLPPYAGPISRNYLTEQDGILQQGSFITDGNLVRAITFDDKVAIVYRYE